METRKTMNNTDIFKRDWNVSHENSAHINLIVDQQQSKEN